MEQWADIPGYEGFYQVSNQGRVRSLIRLTLDAYLRGERKEKKVLKPGKNNQGRKQVMLCRESVVRRFQIHRLVLEAFVGPCPEGMECRHGDGDHTNNNLDNLCWGTHTANMRDKRGHGTERQGEAHTNSKLTETDIRRIRGSGESQKDLADTHGVTQATISYIVNRKTWRHV